MSDKKITVYEKPTCDTCRNLVMLLKEKGYEFERIDYTIDPIQRDKLQVLARKMNGAVQDMVRTKEPDFKALGIDIRTASESEVLDMLAANPHLVQRPIVEIGDSAVVARPPERVNEIL